MFKTEISSKRFNYYKHLKLPLKFHLSNKPEQIELFHLAHIKYIKFMK